VKSLAELSLDVVNEVVEAAGVGLHRPLDLLFELVTGFLLGDTKVEPVDHKLDVIVALELGHAR
jgi:hypothetical protein